MLLMGQAYPVLREGLTLHERFQHFVESCRRYRGQSHDRMVWPSNCRCALQLPVCIAGGCVRGVKAVETGFPRQRSGSKDRLLGGNEISMVRPNSGQRCLDSTGGRESMDGRLGGVGWVCGGGA